MDDIRDLEIRWMLKDELPCVVEISADAFLEDCWSHETFLRHLKRQAVVGKVAVFNGVIVGYVVYELHSRHISILSMAVHPSRWNRKIGTSMLDNLRQEIPFAQSKRIAIITLIPESLLPAQMFFKENKFRAVEVVHNVFEKLTGSGYLFGYVPNQKQSVEEVISSLKLNLFQ